jgi:hypothetical protein
MSSLHPFVAETLRNLHFTPEEAAREFAVSATRNKLDVLRSMRLRLEEKYHTTFEEFEKRILARKNEEIFEESDDYNDWMFCIEIEPILQQRLEKLEQIKSIEHEFFEQEMVA